MVGRAPGGNGCPVSVEVTALRWLRGHSWLNSWFHRARPPADSGPRCHHPPPRAPLETALACLGVLRVLRHVPSSEAKSPLSLSLSGARCVASSRSHLSTSIVPSLFRFLRSFSCNSFARAFLDNLLIPSVFRVFCSGKIGLNLDGTKEVGILTWTFLVSFVVCSPIYLARLYLVEIYFWHLFQRVGSLISTNCWDYRISENAV